MEGEFKCPDEWMKHWFLGLKVIIILIKLLNSWDTRLNIQNF